VVLTAGRGWPAWTPSACLVLALAVVVVAITCGASCASSLALRIPRQVIKTGDSSVEVLLPQSGGCLELDASGWSRVPLIDAVGGPPYRNFANEGGAWVTSRRGPGRLGVLAGVISNLLGEVGHESGPLCQIVTPGGMLMELLGDAGQPGKRPWAGGREFGEPPVEDGGHVSCGAEVSSSGGNLQVEERVLAGLSRQAEQVCTQRRPGRLVGEPGDELGGSVERRHGLGSEELFGRDMEPVSVALDRLVEPHRRVLKLTQQGGGGDGRVVAGEDLLSGRITVCGSPSLTTWR
jgi:hypothetical protein